MGNNNNNKKKKKITMQFTNTNLFSLFALMLLSCTHAQFYVISRNQIQGNGDYYETDLGVYQTELFKRNEYNFTITYPVGVAGRNQIDQDTISFYDEISAVSGNTFSCVTENTIYSIDLKTNQTLPVVSFGYVGRTLKLYAREPYYLEDGTPLGQFIVLTSAGINGSGPYQLYSFVVPPNQILMDDRVPPAVRVFPEQDFQYVAGAYNPNSQLFYGIKPKELSQKGEPITSLTIQVLDFTTNVYNFNFTNKVDFEETNVNLPTSMEYNQVVEDFAFVRTSDTVLFVGIQEYNETQNKYDDFNIFKPEFFSFASIDLTAPISQWSFIQSSPKFSLGQVLESSWDDVNEHFVYFFFGNAFAIYTCPSGDGCKNGGFVGADQLLDISGVAFKNFY